MDMEQFTEQHQRRITGRTVVPLVDIGNFSNSRLIFRQLLAGQRLSIACDVNRRSIVYFEISDKIGCTELGCRWNIGTA